MSSPPPEKLPEPQLFTVRVWAEPLGNGQTELRGQVRHVLSGETRYFREWPDLIAYLSEQMALGQMNRQLIDGGFGRFVELLRGSVE